MAPRSTSWPPEPLEVLSNRVAKEDFAQQSVEMETNWVSDHLQTIRTLMERSALYRRALAPVMILSGAFGLAGAVGGWVSGLESNGSFGAFWLGVGMLTLGVSFL